MIEIGFKADCGRSRTLPVLIAASKLKTLNDEQCSADQWKYPELTLILTTYRFTKVTGHVFCYILTHCCSVHSVGVTAVRPM